MGPQQDATTGAAADAIELLTTDHRVVEEHFRHFEAADPASSVARQIAEDIVRELAVHSVVERQVLYPALRDAGPEGQRLAEHSLEEHQTIDELLASFDGKPVDDPAVRQTFQGLKANVEQHVAEEEGQVFPLLRRELAQDRLMKMGRALDAAKKVAPTHPHPNAPAEGVPNLIAGVAAGLLDRVRDAARSVLDQR